MNFFAIVQKVIWFGIYCICNNIEIRHLSKKSGRRIEQLRTSSLRALGADIGTDSFIRFHSYITHPTHLQMGNNSKIGVGAKLFLYDKLVTGDNVEIGSDLTVHTAEHRTADPNLPLTKQGADYAPVRIDSDVYIGSRVIVLPGSHIQSRVIIGAGSLVKGTLQSGYVYAGCPAKKIKTCSTP